MENSLPLLRGTLDVLILTALGRDQDHGKAISRWIRDTTGGVLEVEAGALYPALRRLERRGLMESRWSATETGRKTRRYALTAEGSTALHQGMGAWTPTSTPLQEGDSAGPTGTS